MKEEEKKEYQKPEMTEHENLDSITRGEIQVSGLR